MRKIALVLIACLAIATIARSLETYNNEKHAALPASIPAGQP